jgi:glycosyltransferase involved in cell wall biosynthesis
LSDKATVIYNPLPEMIFLGKNLGNEPMFLYLGGNSYIKGFNILIKALESLNSRQFKIYMTRISNTGNLPSSLRDKIVAIGEVAYNELPKLHSKAHALLFPSIWEEPSPYVIIESMLMGTIPVASETGGVLEIIGDSPAQSYLFDPGGIDMFIDRIERILTLDKEDLENIGYKLREHVLRNFNNEVIERSLIRVFSRN